MPFFTKLFECAECGTLLDTDKDNQLIQVCNECGSTISNPIDNIQETLSIKFKQVGKSGDPYLKIKISDELYKKTMEWRQIKMVIDKSNDSYEKTVIDPISGQVVFHNKESLSEHTGRGSAKTNKSSTKGDDDAAI